MPELLGTNVAAAIVPFTTEDAFATHDAKYGKGGWREVATVEEMNAIPEARRSIGMIVYVQENNTTYQLKESGFEQADFSNASVYKYKGSVANYSVLPSNAEVGDVYNVEDTGANYAWTGEEWDNLGQTLDLSGYLTKDEASGLYATDEDIATAIENKADKATTLSGYGITDAYTKEEVDSKVSSVYKYKGSVANEEALPAENNVIGDVWNTEDTGANFAWTGTSWDNLGTTVDLSDYLTKDELASELPIASTTILGAVKVDGTTITATEDGTLSCSVEGGASSADEVSYDNAEYPTVKDALDALLYVAPKINSFNGGSTNEIGATVANVNLSWSVNKTVTSQTLARAGSGIGTLTAEDRTYTDTGANLTTNTTYTLTVSDGQKTASSSTTVSFKHKRYWGTSTKESLTNEEIIALSSEFANNRQQTRTFDCSGGKYFYFAIPTSMCSGIQFKVGGLAFSAMNLTEIDFTNSSGNTSDFNVYRVADIQTGSAISVEVL